MLTVPIQKATDLITLSDLSSEDINIILDRGDHWADKLNSKVSFGPRKIDNPIVANLFFESSTRTRFSFEVASKKLGFHVLNFDHKVSSTQKGETLYDTLKTLEAMGVQIVIIRTSEETILSDIASKVKLAVINAGAGSNEHPSQALLDLATIRQHFNRLEDLKVAIIGDIKYSRVARSNILALEKYGSRVLLAGPDALMPDEILGNHTQRVSADEAVAQADVVMLLRLQKERHKELVTDTSSYFKDFGLTMERFAKMQEHAVIMHPAPFNRGVEIADELIECPRSLIYKQVSNGVAIRMAILERAL